MAAGPGKCHQWFAISQKSIHGVAAVTSDVFIIVACTVAGAAVGGVRCLQAAGAGGYRSASVFRHLLRGVVVGLVIGLLVAELKELW